MHNLFISIVLLIFLSGCGAQWHRVNSENSRIDRHGLELELPKGWVTIPLNKSMQVTSNDGPLLNSIVVETILLKDIEKKLKITLPKEIDSLNASKQFLAYWSKNNDIAEFEQTSNDYVEKDDRSFFRIEWHFKDENGMTVKNICQGIVIDGKLINVGYSAPSIYYFEKGRAEFEKVLDSIRVNG